jgi:hypothetical protein
MKLPTDLKLISNFCLKHKLTPISDLTYWLLFGFPPDMVEIDITKYTTKSPYIPPKTSKKKRDKNTLYLDSYFPFGKYKHSTVERIININPNYVKWFINIWDGIVSDEVSKALK